MYGIVVENDDVPETFSHLAKIEVLRKQTTIENLLHCGNPNLHLKQLSFVIVIVICSVVPSFFGRLYFLLLIIV